MKIHASVGDLPRVLVLYKHTKGKKGSGEADLLGGLSADAEHVRTAETYHAVMLAVAAMGRYASVPVQEGYIKVAEAAFKQLHAEHLSARSCLATTLKMAEMYALCGQLSALRALILRLPHTESHRMQQRARGMTGPSRERSGWKQTNPRLTKYLEIAEREKRRLEEGGGA